MADNSSPEQQSRLALYQEARRLSGALKEYSVYARSEFDAFSVQNLLDCVDKYCGALEKLNVLSHQIDRVDTSLESIETRTACEEQRCSIRADLDAASAAFVEPCREALQQRLSASKNDLLLTQKKKKLAAYIRSPLVGQEITHYDRHR